MYVVTAWEAGGGIPLLNVTPVLFLLDKVLIVLVTSMSVISLTPTRFLITFDLYTMVSAITIRTTFCRHVRLVYLKNKSLLAGLLFGLEAKS